MTTEKLELATKLSQNIQAIELTLNQPNFNLSHSIRNGNRIPECLIDKQMFECANEIIKTGLIKNLEKFKKEFESI